MDGNFLQSQINRWLLKNVGLVSALEPATIHLDELIGADFDKSKVLQISLDVFKLLVVQIIEIGNPVKVGLVLPLLSDSKKISTMTPQSIQEVLSSLAKEPPSFYLESWNLPDRFYPVEEYRCFIDFFKLSAYHEGLFAYFKESRDLHAMKNRWEFARGVHIEYYPKNEK